MAANPPMKSKKRWYDELIQSCESVQKDRRKSLQQLQPDDVYRRLNLSDERQLYSDIQALRLKNTEWLDIVTKIHKEWYYTEDQRDQLISIFIRYDPDNVNDNDSSGSEVLSRTKLENFRWVMTRAGEGEESDEDVWVDEHGNFEGCRVPYSGKAVGSRLLKQTPHLILGKNASNTSQTILRFAVTLNLEWPIRVVYQFYQEQCLPNRQYHARFMADLSHALQEEVHEISILDIAVAKGRVPVVEALVNLLLLCNIDQSPRAKPLHSALTSGFDEIAQYLVTSFPNMIQEIVDEKSVLETLEHSKKLKNKPMHKPMLEDFLVEKICRIEGRPLLVKRLLHGPLGSNKEYHLDLSCFNDPLYDLDTFLTHTELSSAGEPDMFTSIVLSKLLLYMGLPRIQGSSGQSRQEKLRRILDWLLRRNVEGMLKLRIPDLVHNSYREDDIENCLSRFKEIEELNWEKLDMSLEILGDADGKIHGVKKIWLYSVNWGMISYWTGLEGVISYPQSLIGLPKARAYKRDALARLEERRQEAANNGRDLKYTVKVQEWEVATTPDTSSPHSEVSQSSPSSILGLESFLRFYRGLTLPTKSATGAALEVDFSTRVAILDTGVDISHSLLQVRIENGVSFVEYGDEPRESPWWLASDPHGTQMASLILNIDPKSKLFIAKVGIDRRHVIDPENILKGLKWALAQKVDIISISMTFYESHSGLYQLLKTAFDSGVTVICSTADAGQQGPSVYPASWTDRTISVSTCTQHFTVTKLTDHRAMYFLPGEHVSATSLSYAEAEKTVSGSSVATAMASGLASLILSCRNYSRLNEGRTRSVSEQRGQLIRNVFERMLQTQTGKSVVPNRVFNETDAVAAMAQENEATQKNGQPRRADNATWRKWVKEHFGHTIVYDVRD